MRNLNKLSIMFCCLALVAGGGFYWLKSHHQPYAAITQASLFLELLRTNKLKDAFELTLQNELTGKTYPEFEAFAHRQFCNVDTQTTTFPFQSNGNRLKRWIMDRPLDPPKITVEFTGSCLFGVTLQPVAPGIWKVHYFQSHAG
jgi:hypothetical protein